MKVTVPGPALADALSWVATAIPKLPAQPILAGVRIEATSDTLTVAAFDHDNALKAEVDKAEIHEPGVAILPGKFLAAITAKIKTDLELASRDDDHPHVELSAGRSKYIVRAMPVGEYPDLSTWFEADATAAVDAHIFGATLAKVLHASDHDADAPVPALTGIHLFADDGKLWLAATDRYQLARNWLRYNGAFGSALVPARTLAAIVKGMHGQVALGNTGSSTLTLSTKRRTAAVRGLNPESFPQIGKLIERSTPNWAVKFARVEMIEALERLLAVYSGASPAANPVTLLCDDLIELRTPPEIDHAGSEWVTATTEVAAGNDITFPVQLRMNPQFLLNALKACGTDDVEIGQPRENQPVQIKGDSTLSLVLMPVRN